jgi:type I restriction enzyme R subunit
MNNVHLEKVFETDIVSYLISHGWVEGNSQEYNIPQALYISDALSWVKTAHTEAWEKLVSQHGAKAEEYFLSRLCAELEQLGSLHVLRHGFKIAGAGGTYFNMMQAQPRSSRNPEASALFERNMLRVVRQVFYSENNKNSIDLVLFVNGIPVATIELKTESTQSVWAAIKQYQKDRLPKDASSNRNEPLLQFKSRCVVHFAVSTEEVFMTTRLAGDSTYFLPFNKGDNEGKGNPVNQNGPRTAYLWEELLKRENWLHVLSDFVHLERVEKNDSNGRKILSERMIFPRFHQWDAVLKLIDASRKEKAGHRYLIQHSAGSGKSNSIAWLAHHLSALHDTEDNPVYDAVLVITDRTVLDSQLRDTIYQFQKTSGVVEGVTNEEGAKSNKLRDALLGGKRIIVVTIQTFKPLLEKIGNDEDLKTKNFAVIADEAHSSQTGGAAGALKKVLAKEGYDEDEISAEDLILSDLSSRSQPRNVSYYAFTATPKPKTMELFGTLGPDGVKRPFHTYSMQQAIEEKFILDPLQNFISYKVAWKLVQDGAEQDQDEVIKSKARKALTRWVRLHEHNIAQKVKVIVEHFREHVSWRLGGEAKAMVVTASREEVIRYKLAIDAYIREKRYAIGTLVAFSGDIDIKELADLPFNEYNMNPGIHRMDLRDALNTADFQILLVANKYQTGFDQPKLVAMYVDKKLSGVATVQTLSRLNRTAPGKDWTVILDFVNDPDAILSDFQQYYRSASLPQGTDPNLLYALETKVDSVGIYLESEVEAFSSWYWSPARAKNNHFQLQKYLQPPVQRLKERYVSALSKNDQEQRDQCELFVKDLSSYCKLFEFITQIYDYSDDIGIEKRYAFFKELLPIMQGVIRDGKEVEVIDLSGVRLSHYAIRPRDSQPLALDASLACEMEAAYGEVGSGASRDPEKVKLYELIEQLNLIFEGDLSDSDLVNYAYAVRDKLLENDTLRTQAHNNSKKQFDESDELNEAILDAVDEQAKVNSDLASQIMSDSLKCDTFKRVIRDLAYWAFMAEKEKGKSA